MQLGGKLPPPNFRAWIQLVRAYNYMETRINQDLRRQDLTLARFDAMVALVKIGPMSQQALANHLSVTKGNIVGLVDRLSSRGLIERKTPAKDRRVNLVSITPKGQRVVETVLPRQWKLIAQLMKPVNASEAVMLETLLAKLKEIGPKAKCI